MLMIGLEMCIFFFKQKTAYEMRISDWSSDVCSSDLPGIARSRLGEADLGCDLLDELADVAPRPHVARLLLAPHQVAVLVGLELLRQGVDREGIELLHAQEVDVCGEIGRASCRERVWLDG